MATPCFLKKFLTGIEDCGICKWNNLLRSILISDIISLEVTWTSLLSCAYLQSKLRKYCRYFERVLIVDHSMVHLHLDCRDRCIPVKTTERFHCVWVLVFREMCRGAVLFQLRNVLSAALLRFISCSDSIDDLTSVSFYLISVCLADYFFAYLSVHPPANTSVFMILLSVMHLGLENVLDLQS